MKLFFLILLLHIFFINSYAQRTINDMKQNAFKYFCNEILPQEEVLNNSKILFNGLTTGKASSVYDVAYCIGDINLFKDSIPNKIYLDSLENENNQTKYSVIKIDTCCKMFSNNTSSENSYRLYLYNGIVYNERFYVEFLLIHKKNLMYRFVVVALDNNYKPIGYYIKSIVY